MSDIPLASYEDPRWFSSNNNRVGNRGFTGVPAALTTTGLANSLLVVSAKDCFAPSDPSIKIQYAVLAPGAPGALYEDGYPAILAPATDLGFQIIMKRAGSWGNYFTLTLVNPGRVALLKIARPAAKDVVITLAHSGGAAPTTIPAQLIAAINSDAELSEYMVAFASSATVAPIVAMAKRSFLGGSDVPGLVLVSLASNNLGAVTGATGATTAALLNGSRYVTAANAAGNNGTAAVAALGPVALAGGTANRGEVADQFLARRSAWAKRRRAGDPLGKETNKTLQIRNTRFGAMRNYQRVPRQDRAVVTSSFQNHATDGLAAHSLG